MIYIDKKVLWGLVLALVPVIGQAGLVRGSASTGSSASSASSAADQGTVQTPAAGETQSTATDVAAAQFGETEPNDSVVSADPLSMNALYWGQSYAADDEDWFFFKTPAPNQKITLTFDSPFATGPGGWTVTVTDRAGNRYAEFDSAFTSDSPITYPVFLPYTGTYYLKIRPTDAAIFFPYNFSAALASSDLDAPVIDVNFFDVEIEPNDTPADANGIASGVNMNGMLAIFDTPTGFGGDLNDVYVYSSPGGEILSLQFCNKGDCGDSSWEVVITNEAGDSLADFTTDNQKLIFISLLEAGDYFVHVTLAPALEGDVQKTVCLGGTKEFVGADDPDCGTAIGATGFSCTETDDEGTKSVLSCALPVFQKPVNSYSFTVEGTRLPINTVDSPEYQQYLDRLGE